MRRWLEHRATRRSFATGIGAGVLLGAARAGEALVPKRNWRPDGKGSLARLGVLTPHFDPVPETEIAAMAPAGVSVHAARVSWTGGASAFAAPPFVDDAVGLLTGAGPRNLNPDAILFGFTSSSYAMGSEQDAAVQARLEARSQGVPIIMAGEAAKAAMHRLGARKVCLIHPPWFSETVNEQGRNYFREAGYDVVACVGVTPSRSFVEVEPREVFEFASKNVPDSAEAVFFGGNGMRCAGAIAELEKRLNRPVLAANQVLLWEALRRLGLAENVRGYGRIFRL